jgi:membrane protease YdiL (CAAX protease family)
MNKRSTAWWPIAGSLAALILSPLLEFTTGMMLLYSLAVLALLIVFWGLTRLSRRQMGIQLGDPTSYGMGLLYPVGVMGVIVAIAAKLVGLHLEGLIVSELARDLVFVFGATVLAALLTEDGYFRGWLWGALDRESFKAEVILVWTSIVFCLWHVPVALFEPGFRLPLSVVPVYLTNVLLLGLNWGVMRLVSGSVIVPSVSHALWNALAYVFFGYGTTMGKLGIESYSTFDPERGWVGIVLNILAFGLLWRWWKRRERARTKAGYV